MRLAIGVAVWSLLCAGARADEPLSATQRIERAKSHFERGQALFKSGEYGAAALEFEAGYEFQPLALLLWNAGQAYRKAGQPAKALDAYRRYLAAEPKSKKRADVEKNMRELESELGSAARPPPAAAAARPAPAASAPAPAEIGAVPDDSPPARAAAAAPVAPAAPVAAAPVTPADDAERPPIAGDEPSSAPPRPAIAATATAAASRPVWYKDVLGDSLVGGGVLTMAIGAGVLGDALATIGNANRDYDSFLAARGAGGERTAGAVVLSIGAVVTLGGAVRWVLVSRRR